MFNGFREGNISVTYSTRRITNGQQVFMTRRDELKCIHDPFGDAFYYGPERLSDRFADDEEAR